MHADETVFVVDDDVAVRKSLRRLMEAAGLHVETFESAQAFLDGFDRSKPGCLVLDISMPGMSGLNLQEDLAGDARSIPVIILSAHGNVETSVRAMKTGAVDFLKKPCRSRLLLERVREAFDLDADRRRKRDERAKLRTRLEVLTPREREVMGHLVRGESAKEIAKELGVARKTIDIHNGHIKAKLGAKSVVDLVHMWPG